MQGRYGTSISTEIRSSRWLIPFPASALLAVHVLTPAPSVRSAWRTRLWSMLVPASIAAPARASARPVQSTLNKQFCTPCAASCGPRFFVGGFCSFFALVPSLQRRNRRNSHRGQKTGVARRGGPVCPSEAFRRGQDPALQIPGRGRCRGREPHGRCVVPGDIPSPVKRLKFLCFFLYQRKKRKGDRG